MNPSALSQTIRPAGATGSGALRSMYALQDSLTAALGEPFVSRVAAASARLLHYADIRRGKLTPGWQLGTCSCGVLAEAGSSCHACQVAVFLGRGVRRSDIEAALSLLALRATLRRIERRAHSPNVGPRAHLDRRGESVDDSVHVRVHAQEVDQEGQPAPLWSSS